MGRPGTSQPGTRLNHRDQRGHPKWARVAIGPPSPTDCFTAQQTVKNQDSQGGSAAYSPIRRCGCARWAGTVGLSGSRAAAVSLSRRVPSFGGHGRRRIAREVSRICLPAFRMSLLGPGNHGCASGTGPGTWPRVPPRVPWRSNEPSKLSVAHTITPESGGQAVWGSGQWIRRPAIGWLVAAVAFLHS